MDQFDVAMRAQEAGKYAVVLQLLLPLAEAGDAKAQFHLGQLYREGHGVKRDHEMALRWYRKAAGQGNAMAQGALGAMYYGGQGVAQDYAEALKWLNLAADEGVAEAQYDLSLMYGHGHGVTLNYMQAHMWCNIAGAQGHAKALKSRDALAAQMTLIQIAEAQRLARDWTARHTGD